MKVADIVKYVLLNRRNKVCKGWTPYQITYEVDQALTNHTLAYTTDANGNLTGVVWGCPNWEQKVLYIETILTTSKDALPALMKHFFDVYTDWIMSADRRGKFVKYNTTKLKKIFS
jgi:hypothetical protein